MEPLLEWQSPEHHFDKKSNDWYWILGIIALGASVLAFYFHDFLFGIFILIAGGMIGFLSFKETQSRSVKITAKGILFGQFLYPWTSYKSFWIEDEHIHGFRILLNPVNSYLPLTIVPVNENVELNDLRDLMLEFLEEEFLAESIIHKWFDHLIARW